MRKKQIEGDNTTGRSGGDRQQKTEDEASLHASTAINRRELLVGGALLAGAGVLLGKERNAHAMDPIFPVSQIQEPCTDFICVDTIGFIPDPNNCNLRAISGSNEGARIAIVEGFNTPGDGGGGVFHWNETGGIDDGGTFIVPGTVAPLPPASGAKGSGWKRIYSGPLNVKWFGALPSAKDNKGMIQMAVNACPASGSVIEFPPGIYTILAAVEIWTNDITLRGDSFLSEICATSCDAVTFAHVSRIKIERLRFSGGSPDHSCCAIKLKDVTNVQIDRCWFSNNGYCIWCDNVYPLVVTKNTFGSFATYGIYITDSTVQAAFIAGNRFDGPGPEALPGNYGIYAQGLTQGTIIGNVFESWYRGVSLIGCNGVFVQNYFEANHVDIDVNGSNGVEITGNYSSAAEGAFQSRTSIMLLNSVGCRVGGNRFMGAIASWGHTPGAHLSLSVQGVLNRLLSHLSLRPEVIKTHDMSSPRIVHQPHRDHRTRQ